MSKRELSRMVSLAALVLCAVCLIKLMNAEPRQMGNCLIAIFGIAFCSFCYVLGESSP